MDLNTPPPGADRAADLVPAVLRPAIARPPSAQPNDALGTMLRGSRNWNTVQTPVSRSVTVVSWLLLCLDIVAIFVTQAFAGESGFFATVLTWNGNPVIPILISTLAAAAMICIAAMTHGLRRADLMLLRVWVGTIIGSVIGVAAMIVALGAFLLMVAFGLAIVIGIAIAALDG